LFYLKKKESKILSKLEQKKNPTYVRRVNVFWKNLLFKFKQARMGYEILKFFLTMVMAETNALTHLDEHKPSKNENMCLSVFSS
jgi:hypothetical protein